MRSADNFPIKRCRHCGISWTRAIISALFIAAGGQTADPSDCYASDNNEHDWDSSMTKGQIAWAQSHDWYRGQFTSFHGNIRGVTVVDVVRDENGKVTEEEVAFTDIRKLREWAGY